MLTQHAPTASTVTVLSVWAVMYNKLSMVRLLIRNVEITNLVTIDVHSET